MKSDIALAHAALKCCGMSTTESWLTIEDPYTFVRDWRVAGKLMEKAFVLLAIPGNWDKFYVQIAYRIKNKNINELPRAIIETCVDVLS